MGKRKINELNKPIRNIKLFEKYFHCNGVMPCNKLIIHSSFAGDILMLLDENNKIIRVYATKEGRYPFNVTIVEKKTCYKLVEKFNPKSIITNCGYYITLLVEKNKLGKIETYTCTLEEKLKSLLDSSCYKRLNEFGSFHCEKKKLDNVTKKMKMIDI